MTMIAFHSFFDLYYLAYYDIDVSSGPLFFLARSTALIFIFLVGLSLTLSHSKALKDGLSKGEMITRYVKRGTIIFSWGLSISIVTWIFIPDGVIVFGILHFIGISIPLAYFFLRFEKSNLLFGCALVVLGFIVKNFTSDTSWFLWLGVKPSGFYTVDYFPLLPWFGVVLFGIYFGKLLYPRGERKLDLPSWDRTLPVKIASFLGRHSLVLYLVHQPVIIGLMLLFGVIEFTSFFS